MRTRTRIHPYLAADVDRRLAAYCAAKGLTESAVVQAAVEDYLDAGEKDNALILRRLDRLGRASTRHQRDLEILSEAFAVYVRYWCAYLPDYSRTELDAARRAGAHRYERFVEFVSFAQRFFPNARLVADKFHVLRLLSAAINRHRRLVEDDRRSAALRRLLLCSRFRLEYADRFALDQWPGGQPVLREFYEAKETLHSFYRTRGYDRAKQALTALTDRLSASALPELQTLRRTLLRWRREILAYFATGLTNGRTEGFNNKAKVVKRRAYGDSDS